MTDSKSVEAGAIGSPPWFYQIHNLTIRSTFECPELRVAPPTHMPTTEIRSGVVPESIEGPHLENARVSISRDEMLLRIPGVARYWMRGGREIQFQAESGATDREVRLFLLGSALGIHLLQRGSLPLHASAVVKDGRCLLFSGINGAGKSTLTYTLLKRGWRLLGDDVTVVDADSSGAPIAYPGLPFIKLWKDALERNAGATAPVLSLQRIRPKIDKFNYPAAAGGPIDPVRVTHFFLLQPGDRATVAVVPIEGHDRLEVIARNTYRKVFARAIVPQTELFTSWTQLLGHFPMFRVRRPPSPTDPEALADAIEALVG